MIKKTILTLCAFLVQGCTATTVHVIEMPKAPQILLEPCTPLKAIPIPQSNDDYVNIDLLMDTLIDNNHNSVMCEIKVDGWIDWYNYNRSVLDAN